MKRAFGRSLRPPRLWPVIFVLLAILVVLGVRTELPPATVVIETGPVGGGYHDNALKYAELLQKQGIKLILRPKADSLAIIHDVQDPASDVQIGFTAQDVDANTFPNVATLGRTEVQPLFIFYNRRLGQPKLRDLLGRNIVMPPQRSASGEAALKVLSLVGVTPANTTITFLPLGDVVARLRSGEADAGMVVLSAENGLVSQLAIDPELRLLSIERTVAISRLLPFFVAVTLPAGLYGLHADIPSNDVTTLGAPVDVVVRTSMKPAMAYQLLAAMTAVHHKPTLMGSADEFPTGNRSELPVLAAAQQYYKTGVPWIYRELPQWLAGFVDRYATLVLALLVMAQVYLSSKWIYELSYFMMDQLGMALLVWIYRSTMRRKQLSARRAALVRAVERTLVRQTNKQRRERLIERIHTLTGESASSPKP